MVLTRRHFQQLARTRVRESRVLLRNGHYEGSYYLVGLAVECALKACIARKTRRHDFPDKQVVMDSYTHDLTRLLKTAGLLTILDRDRDTRPTLMANWAVVKDWSIESRYATKGKQKAYDLYNAVTAREGVFPWIRQHW